MKILAIADLHGAQYRLNILLDNVEKHSPELVIICGDITQFGPPEVATNFLNQIPVETFAIPGNCDPEGILEAISKSSTKNIHLKQMKKKGLTFIGIGGTIQSPIQINNKPLSEVIDEHTILVTHEPPYSLQDKQYIGHHIGSKELKEIVDTYEPKLVLCGHVHENPGCTIYRNTTVVNCSLGKRTEGALITITDNNIDVNILD